MIRRQRALIDADDELEETTRHIVWTMLGIIRVTQDT